MTHLVHFALQPHRRLSKYIAPSFNKTHLIFVILLKILVNKLNSASKDKQF